MSKLIHKCRESKMQSKKCKDCKEEARPGRSLCATHLEMANINRKSREQARKASGMCVKCPLPADTGFTSCVACRNKYAAAIKNRNASLKSEVFNHYGGAHCACCKVDLMSMLTIDHINGGGNKHRADILNNRGGASFYRWLKNNKYPDGYQVLCWNCNLSKRHGKCEHITMAEALDYVI